MTQIVKKLKTVESLNEFRDTFNPNNHCVVAVKADVIGLLTRNLDVHNYKFIEISDPNFYTVLSTPNGDATVVVEELLDAGFDVHTFGSIVDLTVFLAKYTSDRQGA